MTKKLTTTDHSRNIAGLKYVYPVISRRAGGVSIGINLNTNNACNWRCVYCQVPDLVRGSAPEMDLDLLEKELMFFLKQVLSGDFYEQYEVPEQYRIIKDIAISGNGEPTSLKGFDQAITLIASIATELKVLPASQFVLITNGSLIHQASVQAGLRVFNNYNGQVWFKLDSATVFGRKRINDNKQAAEKVIDNLNSSIRLCETSLQTCMLNFLKASDIELEQQAYIKLLQENKIKVKRIMLYTLARPSLQPEAEKLSQVDEKAMALFAYKLRNLGYQVSVTP